jgi:hypothetical protein
MSSGDDDTFDEFRRWLAESKCTLQNVTLVRDSNDEQGNSAVASRAMNPGDDMISVPLSMLVTHRVVRRTAPFDRLYAKFSDRIDVSSERREESANNANDVLAVAHMDGNVKVSVRGGGTSMRWLLFYLFMLWQRAIGARSSWQCYWRVLPECIPTPLEYDDDELCHLLGGTNLMDAVLYIKASLDEHRRTAVPALLEALRDVNDDDDDEAAAVIVDEDVFSMRNVLWAYRAFWSRAYVVETLDGAREPALVPLADMLNHESGRHVTYLTDVESATFRLRTHERVEAGAPCSSNYGARSNEKLLLNYGFTEPDNALDSYFLRLRMPAAAGDDEVAALRRRLIADVLRTGVNHYLLNASQSDVPVDAKLMNTLRVLFCSEQELYEFDIESARDVDPSAFAFPVGTRTEVAAHIMLRSFVIKRLDRLPRYAVDCDVASLSANARRCHAYVLGQRALLERTLRHVDSALAELRSHALVDSRLAAPLNAFARDAESTSALVARTQRAIDAYEAWARDADGIECRMHAVVSVDPMGRGARIDVLAAQPIDVDEPMLSMDADRWLLSMRWALERVGPWMQGVADALDEEDCLFALLMHERAAPDSRWRAFFDALPSYVVGGTVCFAREPFVQRLLDNTTLLEQSVDAQANLRQDFQNLLHVANALAPDDIDTSLYTWSNYRWARCVFETRCAHLNGSPHVVPIAVLPPHHPNAFVERVLDGDRFEMCARSAAAVDVGDPLYDHYGANSNQHLALYHGTVVDRNPHDVYLLRVAIDEHGADADADNVERLASLGVGNEHPLRAVGSRLPAKLVAIMPKELVAKHLQETVARHQQLIKVASALFARKQKESGSSSSSASSSSSSTFTSRQHIYQLAQRFTLSQLQVLIQLSIAT